MEAGSSLGKYVEFMLFGDNVEIKIGRLNFLLFYILSGFVATLVHYFANVTSELPVIGVLEL
jgi:membrane associated rhomboid family serine protease